MFYVIFCVYYQNVYSKIKYLFQFQQFGQNYKSSRTSLYRHGLQAFRALHVLPRVKLLACTILLTALLTALSACGGGGGGDGASGGGNPDSASRTPTPPPTPTPQEEPEIVLPPARETFPASHFAAHPEYQNQVGLAISHAAEAYARNLTGEGIVIGFTDTGLATNHPEFFDDRVIFNDRSGYGSTPPTDDQLFHGTAVASIAAGQRGSGTGMHGLAYNSDIAMWSLKLNNNGTLDVDDRIFSQALNTLESRTRPAVVNHSWGYAIQFDPSHAGTQRDFLRSDFNDSIRAMADSNAIHVWSAGNEAGNQVSVTAAFPLLFPELHDHSIIVVSVDGNGVIGRLSNHCGAAKALCIAAPGGNNSGARYIRAARASGGYTNVVGTSFAAPHVAAALALLRELFGSQMSNEELVERLLLTADDSGIYANEDIYGHGLLDLNAATHPVGPSYIPVERTRIRTDDSGFNFFVDENVKEHLRRQKIIIHDSLDAPFAVPLSVFSQTKDKQEALTAVPPHATPTPSPTAQWSLNANTKARSWQSAPIASLTSLVSQDRYDNRPQQTLLRSPFIDLAGMGAIGQISTNGLQLSSFASWHDSMEEQEDPRMISGFSAGWQTNTGALTLGLNGGILFEEDALLGGEGRGAFALADYGRTIFAGVGGEMPLAFGWQSAFGAYFGQTGKETIRRGLLDSIEPVAASSFSGSVWKQLGAMSVYAKLSQPLRVDSGKIHFQLPVARLPGGDVVMKNWTLPLQTSGREVRGELGMRHFTTHGQISLRMQMRHEPEHVRHAPDEFAASLGWQMGF